MRVEQSLEALARLAGFRVDGAQPLSTESRNSLWRVTLDGPVPRAVLKVYDPEADVHAANRYRREEKVLTLLGSLDPPVSPRFLAGFLAPGAPALLLMEDAGERSIADRLSAAIWPDAIAFVRRLHAGMERLRQPLYRTAMAISLDRINAGVLESRFRIAGKRLAGRDTPRNVLASYRELMAPLLASPRAMIHNSLSPLNIVSGPSGWRAIDWETLAFASPLWDWAELLRSPYEPMAFDDCVAIAARETATEPSLFCRAVLSRCLDSLATVSLRLRRYEEESNPERAAEYARRAGCYMDDIQEALPRLSAPAALDRWLKELIEVKT